MNFTEPERRRGIPELADNVRCLAEGFEEARVQIAHRFDAIEREIMEDVSWRDSEAKPILDDLAKTIAKATWVMVGGGGAVTVLGAVVVWIFLTTYDQLRDTAQLTNENAKVIAAIISRMEADDRHEQRNRE